MEKITVLRGPERVRRRPAVIFGSDDADGAATALELLLDVLAREGMGGNCSEMKVTQYLDGSIEIQDNGRGIFLGNGVWQELFCQLYAGPLCPDGKTARCIFEKPSGKEGEYTDSLELCAVQYASEYMRVCVVRGGYKQMLHFEKGNHVGGITETPSDAPSGTNIRFRLDTEVFTDVLIPSQQISEKLQIIAIQIPGMTTTFRCETARGFEETAFYYPRGVADFLQEQNPGEALIHSAGRKAEGQERYNRPRYGAAVTIGIGFAKNAGFVRCYHNLKELTHGGTHCDALLHSIAQRMEWMLECEIREEELQKHLQLVVSTNAEHSEWTSGARTGLRSIFLRDLTQDTLDDGFQQFLKENKEPLCELLQHS